MSDKSVNASLAADTYSSIFEGINQIHALVELAGMVNINEVSDEAMLYYFSTIAEVTDKIKRSVIELRQTNSASIH